ncbi:MAG: F0F1 ATP synthase subunit epsilon [Desulfobacterales bacterium]|nr:F0F1 ATP synthase subunit epsilon [Desulfobacterales bacterium]
MPKNIGLQIVTPEKLVVNEDVQIVMAPGVLGEFGVLIGHTPFLSLLKLGVVHYRDVHGVEKNVFISKGFAEVLPDKVTILAESAERSSDIDTDRAQRAAERARKRLAMNAAKENIDHSRASAALDRAMQRLKLAGTIRNR